MRVGWTDTALAYNPEQEDLGLHLRAHTNRVCDPPLVGHRANGLAHGQGTMAEFVARASSVSKIPAVDLRNASGIRLETLP